VAAGIGIGGEDGDAGVVRQRRTEIDFGTVDDGSNGRLRKAGSDRGGEIGCRGPGFEAARRTVGQRDADRRPAAAAASTTAKAAGVSRSSSSAARTSSSAARPSPFVAARQRFRRCPARTTSSSSHSHSVR